MKNFIRTLIHNAQTQGSCNYEAKRKISCWPKKRTEKKKAGNLGNSTSSGILSNQMNPSQKTIRKARAHLDVLKGWGASSRDG